MLVDAPPERRIATRFQPAFGTVCRLGPGRPVVGLVWNISETGVSMLIADPPEAGAELPAELAHDGWEEGHPVRVQVVHVRQVDTGDYLLGAKFVQPLTADEVLRFVTPPPKEERELPRKG